MFFRITGLFAVAAVLVMTHSASALDERLKEIVVPADDTITLQPGETRVFQFDESIKQVFAPGDTVEITPQSDRTLSIRGGNNPGATIATVLANDGHVIRRLRLVVGGHAVKIYGVGGDKDEGSTVLVQICDEFGCDDPPSKGPIPKSVTVRRPLRGGGFVEKTY